MAVGAPFLQSRDINKNFAIDYFISQAFDCFWLYNVGLFSFPNVTLFSLLFENCYNSMTIMIIIIVIIRGSDSVFADVWIVVKTASSMFAETS